MPASRSQFQLEVLSSLEVRLKLGGVWFTESELLCRQKACCDRCSFLFFPMVPQVVLLKTTVRAAETPFMSSRAACVCSLWSSGRWI